MRIFARRVTTRAPTRECACARARAARSIIAGIYIYDIASAAESAWPCKCSATFKEAVQVWRSILYQGMMRAVFVLAPVLSGVLTGSILVLATMVGNVAAGSNAMALRPPMTWRSWNQFAQHINSSIIESMMNGLVDTSRPIVGMPPGSSLFTLGYNEVGLDSGWAKCMPAPGFQPINSTSHKPLPDGTAPTVINTALFPDMKALVASAHAKGLRAGWCELLPSASVKLASPIHRELGEIHLLLLTLMWLSVDLNQCLVGCTPMSDTYDGECDI